MKKMELSDRLQQAMEVRGLRAVDLVDKTGIPKVTISYYMTGKTTPRADNLYKIAQALVINEAWLLGYDVPMERSEESKKNDQLSELIVKMRQDAEFFEVVSAIGNLSNTQYQLVKQLLAAFRE